MLLICQNSGLVSDDDGDDGDVDDYDEYEDDEDLTSIGRRPKNILSR